MNYYEAQLVRMRRNFDFSLKIYEGRVLEQLTLCVQMAKKVENFEIPRNVSALYGDRKKLATYIWGIYAEIRTQEEAGKYGNS